MSRKAANEKFNWKDVNRFLRERGVTLISAGLDEVPVLVKDVPDQAAAAMALIENIQREDLNPLEEAQGIQRLLDEFNFTHEQAAESVGRSRSAVSNLLRLLNLAAPVQQMIETVAPKGSTTNAKVTGQAAAAAGGTLSVSVEA